MVTTGTYNSLGFCLGFMCSVHVLHSILLQFQKQCYMWCFVEFVPSISHPGNSQEFVGFLTFLFPRIYKLTNHGNIGKSGFNCFWINRVLKFLMKPIIHSFLAFGGRTSTQHIQYTRPFHTFFSSDGHK